MTVMVVRVVGVLLVAVVLVVVVGGEFFLGGFFGELDAMKHVGVGDVSLMRRGHGIIDVVGLGGEAVVLGSQFKMMGRFEMRVARFFVQFVVVLGNVVVRHVRGVC